MPDSTTRSVAVLAGGEIFSSLGLQVALFVIPLFAILNFDANPLQLAFLNLMESLSAMTFGLVIGAAIDKFDGVTAVMFAHLIRFGALSLLALSLLADPKFWMLLVAMFLLGLGGMINEAGIDSALVNFGRDTVFLNRANSAMRASSVLSDIGGPGIAGLAVALLGMTGAVFSGALGFAVAAFCVAILITLRRKNRSHVAAHNPLMDDAAEGGPSAQAMEMFAGIALIRRSRLLAPLVAGTVQFNAFSAAFQAVFVYYCIRVLGFGAGELAVVGIAAGVGGVVGAAMSSTRFVARFQRYTYLVAVSAPGAAVAIMLLAEFQPSLAAVSLIAIGEFIFSGSVVMCIVLFNTIRQLESPDGKVGQVAASERVLALSGEIPGALLGGAVGVLISPSVVLAVAAVGMIAAAIWPARADWGALRDSSA